MLQGEVPAPPALEGTMDGTGAGTAAGNASSAMTSSHGAPVRGGTILLGADGFPTDTNLAHLQNLSATPAAPALMAGPSTPPLAPVEARGTFAALRAAAQRRFGMIHAEADMGSSSWLVVAVQPQELPAAREWMARACAALRVLHSVRWDVRPSSSAAPSIFPASTDVLAGAEFVAATQAEDRDLRAAKAAAERRLLRELARRFDCYYVLRFPLVVDGVVAPWHRLHVATVGRPNPLFAVREELPLEAVAGLPPSELSIAFAARDPHCLACRVGDVLMKERGTPPKRHWDLEYMRDSGAVVGELRERVQAGDAAADVAGGPTTTEAGGNHSTLGEPSEETAVLEECVLGAVAQVTIVSAPAARDIHWMVATCGHTAQSWIADESTEAPTVQHGLCPSATVACCMFPRNVRPQDASALWNRGVPGAKPLADISAFHASRQLVKTVATATLLTSFHESLTPPHTATLFSWRRVPLSVNASHVVLDSVDIDPRRWDDMQAQLHIVGRGTMHISLDLEDGSSEQFKQELLLCDDPARVVREGMSGASVIARGPDGHESLVGFVTGCWIDSTAADPLLQHLATVTPLEHAQSLLRHGLVTSKDGTAFFEWYAPRPLVDVGERATVSGGDACAGGARGADSTVRGPSGGASASAVRPGDGHRGAGGADGGGGGGGVAEFN